MASRVKGGPVLKTQMTDLLKLDNDWTDDLMIPESVPPSTIAAPASSAGRRAPRSISGRRRRATVVSKVSAAPATIKTVVGRLTRVSAPARFRPCGDRPQRPVTCCHSGRSAGSRHPLMVLSESPPYSLRGSASRRLAFPPGNHVRGEKQMMGPAAKTILLQ
jgi:hypothetical protein